MAANGRARRIAKELADVENDKTAGISVWLVSDDVSHLKGSFSGPQGTPYEGGTFVTDITIPIDYPFRPPIVKFDTRVYHPNISSQTGAICLDILKDQWSPVYTIKSALISLQSLLCTPEPNNPQDAQVAGVYLKDHPKFVETAREWTRTYANAGEPKDAAAAAGIDKHLVDEIVALGFPSDKVVGVLQKLGVHNKDELEKAGGVNKALDALLA
ncbi:ubiquitin conjugating enzyme Ubc1 [Schizosaccharomyces japonicus yFS275]|uniref:Ubiquitin-conjugating enzyme E2 1 n=1 Tax=Schizosaccharomyces japonicus (strain yFS275 / FY16936) TaxID=402676 RepID=B6JX05_SCHJY|nr:ubiquitin conjugating enzyme Ubc1 [Schizosaccharomyces japonicus yFS275]EEB05906.2 ubiquitin conjugating enzyme Ubc1 [Schizosaccharomyces japonicus yFS275]